MQLAAKPQEDNYNKAILIKLKTNKEWLIHNVIYDIKKKHKGKAAAISISSAVVNSRYYWGQSSQPKAINSLFYT